MLYIFMDIHTVIYIYTHTRSGRLDTMLEGNKGSLRDGVGRRTAMFVRRDCKWWPKGECSLICNILIFNKENVFLVNVIYIGFSDKTKENKSFFPGDRLSEYQRCFPTNHADPRIAGVWGKHLLYLENHLCYSEVLLISTPYTWINWKQETVENCHAYLF